MTTLEVGYQNQAAVTRGVAIFTDAMRGVVRRELEARHGIAWWDVGVWPWLSPGQRDAIDESRANDNSRPAQDFLDASHFRAVMLDAAANYALFARYLPGRGDARRAFDTVRHAKNLLVSHRRSGDTPPGAAIAALEAMQHLVARADSQAADELAHLVRDVIARRDQLQVARAAAGASPTTCALCDQRLPRSVILVERGTPRHVDAGAYASTCEALFGAPLCATHVRAFDPFSAAMVDGLVIGHTRGGLVVDVSGKEGFVPRRYCVALRAPFLSDADVEALLVQQRGRSIRLQSVDQGNGRRPVYREVHPDESLVLDVDKGPRCRAIRLPVESSLGTIHVHASRPSTLGGSDDRRPAMGVVIVPHGSFVWLEAEALVELSALAGLGASDLQGLLLRGEDVGDAVLDHISHLEGLEHIVLRSTCITDEGVGRLIATYPRLRALEVVDARHVTGTALASAAVSPSLEHLSFAGTPLGDGGAAGLVRWRGLHSLDLRGAGLSDASLQVLAGLSGLEAMDLSETAVGDEGLPGLAALGQLSVLQLGGTRVTDAGLKHLGRLPRLAFLGLARTGVSAGGLVHLAGVPTLRRLDVSGTDVSGADLLCCGGFEGWSGCRPQT